MSTPRQQFAKRLLSEGVAAPLEPSQLSAEAFYTKSDSAEPWNDTLSYTLSGKERDDAFLFAEAYAAAVSKNLQEELARTKKDLEIADLDAEHYRVGGNDWAEMSQEWQLRAEKAEARILELEKEIAALWIPIEKKLPESRMVVLVKKAHMSPTIQSAFYCPTHSKGPGFYCGERLTDVTHWRPFTEGC
jgi:hypothetical protein